jgi:ubiquinone/menaquinone biosynthesis C-methylase UbiE
MNKIDYDDRLHARYHEGRAHDQSVMRLWRETVRRVVGNRNGLTILDLGSGTGRFSSLLADKFEAHVVGVEPSDKMRAVAEAECRHPKVCFLKGAAEDIPLPNDSCDVAWLSQIVHHLTDLDAAAKELRRVVRPFGLVIFRSNFKGRLDGSCRYYDFFPAGLAVDEARHPTVEHVEECFEQNGFVRTSFETIEQIEARSLKEYAERIALRTYSTFELISDEEYEAGLAALRAEAFREQQPQPVMAKVDLLVFQRD